MDEPSPRTGQRRRQLDAVVASAAVALRNARTGVLQRARAAAISVLDGSPTAASAIDTRRPQLRAGMSAAEREAYRALRSSAVRERRSARLTAAAAAAEQRRAAQVVQRQPVADAVVATTREVLCSEAAVPAPWTFEDAVREAGRFRECIDGLLPECLCAVGGRRTRTPRSARSARTTHMRACLLLAPPLMPAED